MVRTRSTLAKTALSSASSLPLWHRVEVKPDDCVMVQAEGSGTERRVRRWRSVPEKRRIVELTLEPGGGGAGVAEGGPARALVFC